MILDDLKFEIKDILVKYYEDSDLYTEFDFDSCSDEVMELLSEHNILNNE